MAISRPALRYFGGKFMAAKAIISWFPEHRTYVEVFGGGASVLLVKSPSIIEVYNDLYGDVVNFFRCMRDNPEKMSNAIQFTPWSREEYEKSLVILDSDDDTEKARKFFVRSWQSISMGGIRNRPSHFRSTTTGAFRLPNYSEVYAVASRLRDVCIENLDWKYCIEKYDKENILFYVDPPYMDHNEYLHNLNHAELLDRLVQTKNKCLISANRNSLYDTTLKSWNRKDIKSTGLQGNTKTECFYMNY